MSDPTHCPVCGHLVRVVGTKEGTQHYEPIEDPLNTYLDYIEAAHSATPDYDPETGPTEQQIADAKWGKP